MPEALILCLNARSIVGLQSLARIDPRESVGRDELQSAPPGRARPVSPAPGRVQPMMDTVQRSPDGVEALFKVGPMLTRSSNQQSRRG
jgi:hypothetical protein